MSSILTPEMRLGRISVRPEEVLLLCYYDPYGISTVPETVAYLQMKSFFSVTVMNLYEYRQSSDGLELPATLNLAKFSAILIHNTVAYNVDNLRSLDRLLPVKLSQFAGVKVLLKQDENFRFQELARYIGEVGFDVIFTCLPSEAVDKIYPPETVGKPRFVRMLTGYVTPSLRSLARSQIFRPIDIGYRGSIQPLSFGQLAYEKRKIGDDVGALLMNKGLTLDISSRWDDRIGGAGWFKFLSSCKATLGVESGASVFDLGGELEKRCRQAENSLGPLKDDPGYAESFLSFLKDIEGNIYYNQLSPRHFEAVATQTLQLLYPGNYSGIFQPGKHYFVLQRNYSNLQEGVELLLDESRRRRIVDCAYEEILQDKKYWIESFVEQVDSEISIALERKGLSVVPLYSTEFSATNILLIAAHEPRIDPRLNWIVSNAPTPLAIHQCGVLQPDKCHAIRITLKNGALYQATPRIPYKKGDCKEWLRLVGGDPTGTAATQEMLFIEEALGLPDEEFSELFAAPPGSDRLYQFRWYLKYFLDTAVSLLRQCIEIRGLHAVIATDLDTLLPALILKGIFKIPVIYDAHEYWAESDVKSNEFERSYWVALEKRFVKHADFRQIVSPGLAKKLSKDYGCYFNVLPNCEAVKSPDLANEKVGGRTETDQCIFLFQGGFSPGRGLDLLISAWEHTSDKAILQLRGRDSEYKPELIHLAQKTGLLDKRIFFPAPVDESEMIEAASKADVGLAPYPPTNFLYENCSPNKLSQYMAAHLPILANDTKFVREVIESGKCGIVVNYARQNELVEAINRLTLNKDLRLKLAASGKEFHLLKFNWQALSVDFYQHLIECSSQCGVLSIYPYSNGHYYLKSSDLLVSTSAKLINLTMCKGQYSTWAKAVRRFVLPIWKRLPVHAKAKLRSAVFNRLG